MEGQRQPGGEEVNGAFRDLSDQVSVGKLIIKCGIYEILI
jgi:hypothetical protein